MYCITGTRTQRAQRRERVWCICHTRLVQRLAIVTSTLMIPYIIHIIIFFATDNYSAIEMANPSRSSRLAEWSFTISLCNGPHRWWHQRDWIYHYRVLVSTQMSGIGILEIWILPPCFIPFTANFTANLSPENAAVIPLAQNEATWSVIIDINGEMTSTCIQ